MKKCILFILLFFSQNLSASYKIIVLSFDKTSPTIFKVENKGFIKAFEYEYKHFRIFWALPNPIDPEQKSYYKAFAYDKQKNIILIS